MSSLDELYKNKVGVGLYQIILFLVLVTVDTSEGAQLTLMALLMPIVKSEWILSNFQVKVLTSSFFAGIIIGNLYTDYFCIN